MDSRPRKKKELHGHAMAAGTAMLKANLHAYLAGVERDLRRVRQSSSGEANAALAAAPGLTAKLQILLRVLQSPSGKTPEGIPATLAWFVGEKARRRLAAETGHGVSLLQRGAVLLQVKDLDLFDIRPNGEIERNLTVNEPRGWVALKALGARDFVPPPEFVHELSPEDVHDEESRKMAERAVYLAFETADPLAVLSLLRQVPATEAKLEEARITASADGYLENPHGAWRTMPDDVPKSHPRYAELEQEQIRRQLAEREQQLANERERVAKLLLEADAFRADPQARRPDEYAVYLTAASHPTLQEYRREIERRNDADRAERRNFITGWIKKHGTPSQQARLKEGLLPESEAMQAMARDAFRSIDLLATRYPHRQLEPAPHCTRTQCRRNNCALQIDELSGASLSSEEYSFYSAIRSALQKTPGSCIELFTRTAYHDCQHGCEPGQFHYCRVTMILGSLRFTMVYPLSLALSPALTKGGLLHAG